VSLPGEAIVAADPAYWAAMRWLTRGRAALAGGTGASFTRGVAVLAGGAAAAQAINALVSPILTRLFTPGEIGQLGIYLAFVYVASVGLSLRYEQAVVAVPARPNAARLAILSAALVPVTSVLATVVLAALVVAGIGGFGELPLIAAAWAAVALVATGVFNVLRYWMVREHRFGVISQVVLGQSIGRAGTQVGFGVVALGLPGLLAGDLIGRLLGITRMVRNAGREIVAEARRADRSMGSLAGSYARFPLLGVPSSLINAAAFSLPVPLLAGTYGLAAAGFLALVQRVLGLPLSIIGASVADALHARMATYARERPDRAPTFFLRTGLGLLAIGLPIAVVVAVTGPGLFAFVFGSEWELAGRMAVAMTPWYLAALIVSPLSRVVLVFSGQAGKLIYDVLSLAAVVGAITLGRALALDLVTTVWLLSGLQTTAYAVYFGVLYRLVRLGSRRQAAAPVERLD
jgi:O-antigen/teichoic acid export membrane protein